MTWVEVVCREEERRLVSEYLLLKYHLSKRPDKRKGKILHMIHSLVSHYQLKIDLPLQSMVRRHSTHLSRQVEPCVINTTEAAPSYIPVN